MKIEDDQVRKVILIIPMLTSQVWFPKLLELSQCSDLLTLAHNQQKHQMNKRKLFLIVFLVSGDISIAKGFRGKQQKFYPNLGENLQTFNMNTLGENGSCGVIANRLIHLNQQ